MTRVLIGDAPVHENERLQNGSIHRTIASRRSCGNACALGATSRSELGAPLANLLQCVVLGRWHQFARSGFSPPPGGDTELLLSRLLDVHPA